jgi:hypothetical protein
MATPDLKEIKRPYLSFLDLLRKHRINTLGKIGFINIPKEEIIEAVPEQELLQRLINSLIENNILTTIVRWPALSRQQKWIKLDSLYLTFSN